MSLNRERMALTYYANPEAMPLVIDSLIDAVEPASQRTDLLPVYSFNAGWQDVLKKMRAEGFPVETTHWEHVHRCLCSNNC